MQPTSASKPKSCWDPVIATMILQFLLWILSGFLADFGETNVWVTYAIASFWPVAIWILFRRRDRLSRIDTFYLKYGFLILVSIFFMFGSKIHFILRELFQR